ncbi:MAG: WhiB family transcriptional regulator [Actinomycetota bacterium]|jgi:WhiB family redox-sensing transcriptional regulator|nr:hypothetical protein [Acidimicrobiaceae bacterium]MEC7898976.1 WhiB family transcriptional regulator [Actinomycetota bacterium]|tara:strand:+ start:948 stop:1283 length:336 start_codon:yes stop_codon:yes gene_type:complete
MFAIEYKNEIWREDAACAELGVPTGIFFSEDLGDIARAKRICADCPSLTLCLEAAIDRNEPWGVWGGQLFRKGKILANKRGRGRPRKISRPEDELPVIPIPVHLQSTLRSA